MKFIAIGSNLSSPLGGSLDHLRLAKKYLQEVGFQIISRAPIYRSAPVPAADQPDFLNSIMQVEFAGAPEKALSICHDVERRMGRVRGAKNEARIIDLDIIAWDGIVQSAPPELPHPRMHERAFVLYPLVDIAPAWRHPVFGQTAFELKSKLPGQDIQQIPEAL